MQTNARIHVPNYEFWNIFYFNAHLWDEFYLLMPKQKFIAVSLRKSIWKQKMFVNEIVFFISLVSYRRIARSFIKFLFVPNSLHCVMEINRTWGYFFLRIIQCSLLCVCVGKPPKNSYLQPSLTMLSIAFLIVETSHSYLKRFFSLFQFFRGDKRIKELWWSLFYWKSV
jgi:hypothetical protein